LSEELTVFSCSQSVLVGLLFDMIEVLFGVDGGGDFHSGKSFGLGSRDSADEFVNVIKYGCLTS
jgi:hypothetical protein